MARRVPRWLVVACIVRAFAHGTTGPWRKTEAPALTAADMLKRWYQPNPDAW